MSFTHTCKSLIELWRVLLLLLLLSPSTAGQLVESRPVQDHPERPVAGLVLLLLLLLFHNILDHLS